MVYRTYQLIYPFHNPSVNLNPPFKSSSFKTIDPYLLIFTSQTSNQIWILASPRPLLRPRHESQRHPLAQISVAAGALTLAASTSPSSSPTPPLEALFKEILSSFCGRLSELFSKPSVMETAKTLKVVLHELPGGAEAFELITRFCYGNGRVQLNPTNTCILHCAAHFMDMNKEGLIKETEKSLEGISHWMWTEVIHSLKQCQHFILIASSSGVLDKVLDSLVGRIATPVDASPLSKLYGKKRLAEVYEGDKKDSYYLEECLASPNLIEPGCKGAQ
ncbi:BTB/POZ domain-containing protein SETH6-like [Asparagus officinalis]|uniref:BTB/POZ domain-containing protein SETH6-like n=1 Tax=Asparagus officinalis TaxID=4686 RepID=UPI00098E0727|nr:BTB/POZ domain-containing protein SETH6-like [Asparagus officinalis]